MCDKCDRYAVEIQVLERNKGFYEGRAAALEATVKTQEGYITRLLDMIGKKEKEGVQK